MNKAVCICCLFLAAACNEEQPKCPPTAPSAAAAPAASLPSVDAVAPGQYTNHVGNPAAGKWGADGQWQWHNPSSPEADSTAKYLLAAGLGVAGGAAVAHLMTRKAFEERHPGGWSREASTREVKTYVDKRGRAISETEYYRRKAQSERDKRRNLERKAASAPSKPAINLRKPAPRQTARPAVRHRPASTFRPRTSFGRSRR